MLKILISISKDCAWTTTTVIVMMNDLRRWSVVDFLEHISHLSLVVSLKLHHDIHVFAITLSTISLHLNKSFLKLLISHP